MKRHRVTQLIVTGVAAAAVAVPAAQATTNDRVQLAGSLVAPTQLSEAQLEAGHAPSTRLVQIGGALVDPSRLSAWENGAGGTAAARTTGDSSSGIGTGSIAAFAVLGSIAILAAASSLIFRRRRGLATV